MVNVPSFSAKVVAGRMMEAKSVVPVWNISCTMRRSRASRAFSTWLPSGSDRKGFSPTIHIALMLPSSIASHISVRGMPGSLGSSLPHTSVKVPIRSSSSRVQ